eukprot:2945420-Rhodomonas_salina.1
MIPLSFQSESLIPRRVNASSSWTCTCQIRARSSTSRLHAGSSVLWEMEAQALTASPGPG